MIYLSSDDVVTFGLPDCASNDLVCAINLTKIGHVLYTENQRFIWVHETVRKKRNHGEYHHLVQVLCLDENQRKAYLL